MPWKDKEKQREAIRKHYYANKRSYIEKSYKKRQALRIWVRSIKETTPCADCNKTFPYYVMDFDHLKDKKINISKIVNSGSWIQTKTEVAKCQLVCSNCHRIRTFNRSKV